MITREALRVLHNNLAFIKGVNRQYADEFGKSGAKIGTTVNIRRPNRYFVRKGDAMQTQGTSESFVPLTLATKWGTDISFNSTELTLSLDDFSKRILTPAMAKIAGQIDQDCLQGAITGTYNNGSSTVVPNCGAPVFNVVGTPGTTPGTPGGSATGLLQYNAPIVYLNAGMQMDNQATPRDEQRRCLLSPAAMAQSVGGLSGLFNDPGSISDQYKKGVIGAALGFEFCMDQNVYTFTTGSVGTSLGTGVVTDGSPYITFTGATSGFVAPAGTVFTIAGVNAVNPENQQATGFLQQFVVTAATTFTGTSGTLPVYPTPIVTAATVANGTVTGPTTGGSLSGAAVLLSGSTASTGYQQSLAYHQDAFTFATADLELPNGVDFAARETYDGISMRIVRAFDISNDQMPCRIDVLGGFANLRPELAVRITS